MVFWTGSFFLFLFGGLLFDVIAVCWHSKFEAAIAVTSPLYSFVFLFRHRFLVDVSSLGLRFLF